MELIGIASVIVMPWIVRASTTYFKELGQIPMMAHRVLIVRAIVAVLSLLGAVLSLTIGDLNTIDSQLIETTALAVFNALTATFLYYGNKK